MHGARQGVGFHELAHAECKAQSHRHWQTFRNSHHNECNSYHDSLEEVVDKLHPVFAGTKIGTIRNEVPNHAANNNNHRKHVAGIRNPIGKTIEFFAQRSLATFAYTHAVNQWLLNDHIGILMLTLIFLQSIIGIILRSECANDGIASLVSKQPTNFDFITIIERLIDDTTLSSITDLCNLRGAIALDDVGSLLYLIRLVGSLAVEMSRVGCLRSLQLTCERRLVHNKVE